jgi:hypothetical protein
MADYFRVTSRDFVRYEKTIPIELSLKQLDWIKDNTTAKSGFQDLAAFLKRHDLVDFYEEILNNICGPMFSESPFDWSVLDVKDWIESLGFMSSTAGNVIESELIDGRCLAEMRNQDWLKLSFGFRETLLLACIFKGWRKEWRVECQYTRLSDVNGQYDICYGTLCVLGYQVFL